MTTPEISGVKIDTAVPIPARSPKYPFAQMAVGDSFFAPNRPQNAFGTFIALWGKRDGRKFTTRIRVENGVRGVRVWRTA